MPKSILACLVGGLALVAAIVAGPAQSQTSVDVTLSTGAGTRTLFVENMLGQELTGLDFGTGRSLPFRVRVVDSEFGRQGFNVSATMTHLYKDNSGTLDYATKVASSDVSLGSQTQPLNVLSVDAKVQPLVNTVSTITDGTICGVLELLMSGGACVIDTTNLVGNIQTVTVPVDLSDLSNLPLLPQANETGAFTNPEYGTGTAGFGDPNKDATPATARRVLAGSRVDTSVVLDELASLLATTPLATLVPVETVVAALQAQFPTTWGLLSAAQIDAIILSTVGSVVPLTLSEVLAQSGTYMSLPTLDVNVPDGTTPGDYQGTLVVTALQ